MDQIASSLQKAIQDNYKKLNLLGMASTPEVMCNCTLFNPSGMVAPSNAPIQESISPETIPSQFIPGQKSDATLLPVDPGNKPFILPQGVTPEDIIMQQAAAIQPLIAEAEAEAEAKARATTEAGKSAVVATTLPGEATTVTVATPTLAPTTTIIGGVPSEVKIATTTPSGASGVEKFAAFRYDDLDGTYGQAPPMTVPSYHDTLLTDSCRCNYIRGASDMYALSLSSWLIYITLVVVIYYWFFVRG